MAEHTIKIDGGRMRFIYDDALVDLLNKEDRPVRVSYVEPAPAGGWTADMSPVYGGPVLGPFALRAEALAAEVAWLREHAGL